MACKNRMKVNGLRKNDPVSLFWNTTLQVCKVLVPELPPGWYIKKCKIACVIKRYLLDGAAREGIV